MERGEKQGITPMRLGFAQGALEGLVWALRSTEPLPLHKIGGLATELRDLADCLDALVIAEKK